MLEQTPMSGAPQLGAVDMATGFVLDLPFGLQGWPGWWNDAPDLYEHLLAQRQVYGIEVEDDLIDVPVDRKKIKAPADPHSKTRKRARNPDPEIRSRTEQKDMVKTKAGSKRWGLPIGAHIPGTPYTDEELGNGIKPDAKPKRRPQRTGGTGKRTTDKPATVATPKPKGTARRRSQLMHERDDVFAHGVQRAWGPANDDQHAVRKNKKTGDEQIEYATPARLEAARETAIQRARRETPRPSEWDIRDNKRVNALGGAGSSSITDTLRGDMYQRSANSWAVYVAYGGIDPKTGKDRGFVPCVGCGMKMTWHDDSKFSRLPKFEQDKIVTGTDGGSYNPQNIVPMCAGCNNQRGHKKFWESPVFRDGKPSWYTNREYQATLARTDREMAAFIKKNFPKGLDPKNKKHTDLLMAEFGRPKGKEYGRPEKEVPVWTMPVPPGKVREKKEIPVFELKSEVARRAHALGLQCKADGPAAVSGDRISAKQLNYDGRTDVIEVPDNQDTMVGRYVVKTVDSAWGTYTQHLIVLDDGAVRFVEPDTVALIASGAGDDTDEKSLDEWFEYKRLGAEVEADSTPGFRDPDLTQYWTRGAGLAKWAKSPHPYTALVRALRAKGVPAKHVHGLAARYFKKVFGIWPGQRKKKG